MMSTKGGEINRRIYNDEDRITGRGEGLRDTHTGMRNDDE